MDVTLACNEENMVEVVVAKEVYIKMCNNNNNKLAMQLANLIIMVQIYLEMTKLNLLKYQMKDYCQLAH